MCYISNLWDPNTGFTADAAPSFSLCVCATYLKSQQRALFDHKQSAKIKAITSIGTSNLVRARAHPNLEQNSRRRASSLENLAPEGFGSHPAAPEANPKERPYISYNSTSLAGGTGPFKELRSLQYMRERAKRVSGGNDSAISLLLLLLPLLL